MEAQPAPQSFITLELLHSLLCVLACTLGIQILRFPKGSLANNPLHQGEVHIFSHTAEVVPS